MEDSRASQKKAADKRTAEEAWTIGQKTGFDAAAVAVVGGDGGAERKKWEVADGGGWYGEGTAGRSTSYPREGERRQTMACYQS